MDKTDDRDMENLSDEKKLKLMRRRTCVEGIMLERRRQNKKVGINFFIDKKSGNQLKRMM